MNERPRPGSEPEPGMLSRRVRIGAGLLAGIGATGTAVGLSLIGTSIDLALPLVDLSGPILIAPVIVIPFAAGAFLRGPAAIAATVIGATAAPVLAAFAIDGSCEAGAWILLGLVIAAISAFATAATAAFVGDRAGDKPWFRRRRNPGIVVLVAFGLVGVAAWIAFAARATPCS